MFDLNFQNLFKDCLTILMIANDVYWFLKTCNDFLKTVNDFQTIFNDFQQTILNDFQRNNLQDAR